MAVSTYRRGYKYSSTYILLLKDYILFLGPKAIYVVGGVILSGLLYPLPFATMAAAIYAMMGGTETSVVKVLRWSIEVNVDSAFLYALIFAAGTLTLKYVTTRAVLKATSSWQTSLYWRAVNQLPHIARWDQEIEIPVPVALGGVGRFLNALVRSGFLIGRIITVGVSNIVIVIGGLLVLAWLDPVSVALLMVVAILWLPLYAWAILGMLDVKRQRMRKHRDMKALFHKVLEEVFSGIGQLVDTRRMNPEDMRHFESGYGMTNALLQGLNLIAFVAGVHVFVSIAVIYVYDGASLAAFVRDKIVFFVLLLFVMKAALSVAGLMGRVSRNYAALSTLRAYLHRRRKRPIPLAEAPENVVFAMQATEGNVRHPLSTGAAIFVALPKASLTLDLLPLSNALQIVREPASDVLRYILFLGKTELSSITNPEESQSSPPIDVKVSHEKQDLNLPILDAKPKPEELGVVALTYEAWESLVNEGTLDEFCRDRIVFVIIARPKIPQSPPPTKLLIVCDTVDIVAVGPFSATWDSVALEVFKKGPKRDDLAMEDDEEME